MRTGFPVMKTGFSLCEFTTQGKPCSGPVLALYGTFHEGQEWGYGFPSLPLATRASADVSELVFKHKWQS